ncbi:MAG: class F sortase, partial [Jatrophihabitantaceae bacterium]
LSLAGGQPDSPAGTVLLASHVNYAGQGAGVFASLYRVQPGALVVLTDRAGRASRWRVTGLDDPLKAKLDSGLFTAAGPRRLALITCGGRVIAGQYERNIVVTAIPEASWTTS